MEERTQPLWIITEVEKIEAVEVYRRERAGSEVSGNDASRDLKQVRTIVRERVPLDATALKVQMNGLLKVVGEVFAQAQQHSGSLQLDELELAVEINAEGQVSLLGSGGKIADKGTIKLKFKQVPSRI